MDLLFTPIKHDNTRIYSTLNIMNLLRNHFVYFKEYSQIWPITFGLFRTLGLFFPARLKASSCMTYISKNLKCDRLVISKRQSTELFKVKENHLACLLC